MGRSGRAETVLALTAIMAAAFNLRIGVTEVGPLLDHIRASTGMSAPLAGLLGTIPFACMGVFAPLGMRLVRSGSARWVTAASLLLIVAGTLLRSVAPTAWLVVLATLPLGVGLAVAGVVLPGVIKARFPARTGAAMGAYVAALSTGAAIAALCMVPLMHALGSWRDAFAVSALPTLVCIPLWLCLPRTGSGDVAEPRPVSAPAEAERDRGDPAARRRLIWLLAAVFGLQSVCFAAVTNWIASLYHHHGWSLSAGSLATAVVSILVIPGALIIPALSDRGDRRLWLLLSATLMALGIFGFAFAPTSAAWLWLVVFGIGNGALFPLALTLPQDLADDERSRTVLTTWMLGLGYALSGTGPLIVGGLLDVTGGFTVPMALLGLMGIGAGVVGLAPMLKRHAPSAALAGAASGR